MDKIPVQITIEAPLPIAGRVGETLDADQDPVTVEVDGVPYEVDRQYVHRVPWPIRAAATFMYNLQTRKRD